jgi:Xaa-Pro aminopeptidase
LLPYESRIRRLLADMARRREDAFLCARMSNIRYLTGFTGSDAVLAASPGGVFLITDGRYTEQARAEVQSAEVVIADRKWREAARRIRRMKPARVGFESRWLSVEQYAAVSKGWAERWSPSPDPVEALRMRKDAGELRDLEAAAVIASESLLSGLSRGVFGRAETDLAADIESVMKRLGAGEPSFRTIVASGPRSAMPHAEPIDTPIDPAGPVVIDFGARYRGYCSDETVTLMPRKPSRTLTRIFDAVRKAQTAGIAAVRPGVPCRDVDARVRESLDRSGYLKYFVHSTGHGVGLDIHERPTLSPGSKDRLADGMVVTVEPGVYIPGVGGVRLEDTVAVGATSSSRVTFLPKSPLPLL